MFSTVNCRFQELLSAVVVQHAKQQPAVHVYGRQSEHRRDRRRSFEKQKKRIGTVSVLFVLINGSAFCVRIRNGLNAEDTM